MITGQCEFTDEVVALAGIGAERNPDVPSLLGTALQLRGRHAGTSDCLAGGRGTSSQPAPAAASRRVRDLGFELVARDRRREGAVCSTSPGTSTERSGRHWPDDDAAGQNAEGRVPAPAVAFRRAPPGIRPAVPDPGRGQVARLIGSGYTNKAASKELGISVNTTGTHLRSVFPPSSAYGLAFSSATSCTGRTRLTMSGRSGLPALPDPRQPRLRRAAVADSDHRHPRAHVTYSGDTAVSSGAVSWGSQG